MTPRHPLDKIKIGKLTLEQIALVVAFRESLKPKTIMLNPEKHLLRDVYKLRIEPGEFMGLDDIKVIVDLNGDAMSKWAIGSELRKLGFESVVRKVNGRSVRGYNVGFPDYERVVT